MPSSAMPLLRRAQALIGERGRIVLRSGSWSLVARLCSAANIFLSIPIAYSALDPVDFGLWATLISVVTMAGFLDLGVGNGAMNLIASYMARGERKEAAATLRVALQILLWIGLAFACLASLLAWLLPWQDLPGLQSTDRQGAVASVLILLVAVMIAIPSSLGQRALLALARGERAFQWQALGQLSALAGISIAAWYAPSLPLLTAAAVLAPVAASAAALLQARSMLKLRTTEASSSMFRRETRRRVIREGGLFMVLQVAAALSFSMDLVLISWVVGPKEAGEYGVVQRVFSVIPLLFALAWAPLWPIYRRALAGGDLAWIGTTLRRSVLGAAGIALILAVGLLAAMDPVLGILTPGHTAPTQILLLGLATWVVLEAAGTALATFLNSASVFRFQLASASALALTCLPAKVYVLSHLGYEWLPWATVATYVLTFALPIAFCWRSLWRGIAARQF